MDLSSLIQKKRSEGAATATSATVATTDTAGKAGSVAKVATVAVATPPNSKIDAIIREACEGVVPEVFGANLTAEDLQDIKAGRVAVAYLRCAARSMIKRLKSPE